ncbi:MAG: hypothetical protein GY750_07215, partial [Lentisphaerae bacterium]|nr:hypothetical protein [Lentisphaerota bacterium]
MTVQWKKGARCKVKPEVAHRVFEKIRKEKGHVDLSEIVRISKPHKAPLHNEFEWDDKKCGVAHRREQARYMVRKIEVVHDKTGVSSRQYESATIHVVEPGKDAEPKVRKVFTTTEEILKDPDARAELLSNAIREALAFRRRYSQLSE